MPGRAHPHLLPGFVTLALLYAAAAGLRSAGDYDLGWQLATGRYIARQKQIPSQESFSYTARGAEWIYPPFSSVVFYAAYSLGGFAALSWVSAAACVGTVGVLLRGASIPGVALAIVAVPLIAWRTSARADLFSTVLFAPLLWVLWSHYQGRRPPLWLLAPLMCLWANLHLGFIAGIALLAGYVGMEALELPFVERRTAALARLRRAAPWLAAAALATLLNPWGPRLYVALFRQARLLESLEGHVGDWVPIRLSSASLLQALAWRDPDSAYWWLLGAALLALVVSLYRKQFGAALLLAAAAWLSFRYFRFQALFAMVAVVVAGSLLAGTPFGAPGQATGGVPAAAPQRLNLRLRRGLSLVFLGATVGMVGVRVSDLVSNRHYFSAAETSVFGPGASWWYPERAAAFLLREHLPGQVFHDYNLGGYLTWRIGPQYPVYLDGRAVPFGVDLFFRNRALMRQLPDSPDWQQEVELRGINTLLFSVARYGGLGNIPLQQLCASQAWRPVYLDEVAVILVRNRAENATWIERLQINCGTVRFTPPPSRSAAELFNFYANAGSVLYALARDAEAWEALERARRIFPDDPNLHLTRGQLFQATNRIGEAEQAYKASVRLKQTDAGWYALGRLYATQGRYAEAAQAVRRAAVRSFFAYERYLFLGRIYLAMKQPGDALQAFADALRFSPYRGETAALGAEFQAQVAAGRARAWRSLGDLVRAVSYQEMAVHYTPDDPRRWLELADLHQAQGREASARQARLRAEELRFR